MALLYRKFIARLDKLVPPRFQPMWNHPVGPKTVFFWSPFAKGGLVIAGIGDLSRPADQISISQSGTIAATGAIWARYCVVVIPKIYILCMVNVFICITQSAQMFRAIRYQQSLKANEKEQ